MQIKNLIKIREVSENDLGQTAGLQLGQDNPGTVCVCLCVCVCVCVRVLVLAITVRGLGSWCQNMELVRKRLTKIEIPLKTHIFNGALTLSIHSCFYELLGPEKGTCKDPIVF